ncbi:malic enzyme [Glycocaulis albus]|jgi:malate dehydrogenase (oxaloacetate-decarboxylating)(NADP+)|uniref:Malic enzyme n=1 Tax=Glycocaulis albus TaxID=1382801 RepID=A0ABQ1XEW3_9PROT|nr:NADP-dependent malic enzyme [Glycocaulis albus]MBV5258425.1 NADP-dependent malic enzyme [Synechococcus moorigangaii CMS01]GGG92588.1 malic enzyme [Glycocaulis albus]
MTKKTAAETAQSRTDEDALAFHRQEPPGKLALAPTKPMATQRDLALAYSPGVAAPVKAIAADPDAVYDYTSKGNMVAVVSNGTAILGLGNLGPRASKPVMEGKAVLFKRFADIDAFDLEIDYEDPEKFIDCVAGFGDSFGGINLEDIKSPECFEIEAKLRERLAIPVFHDDQHGTAIIAAAGLMNACHLTNRKFEDLKVVLIGAGAAGLSVLELIKSLGVQHDHVTIIDVNGVVHSGRDDLHPRLAAHARETDLRTLDEAMVDADVMLGLSAGGIVSQSMVKSMAADPIIFAMANPVPEIMPDLIKQVRSDAIIATGRSDFPNQVNNVLGFPYIFRGALDVRATTINEEMKLAAARALADLARTDVPDEVARANRSARLSFGRDYIIPSPFDPRLISFVPPYVAQAAVDSGVARLPMPEAGSGYRARLARRLDPTAALQQHITEVIKAEPKRIVFAEGEEPSVIRAAAAFQAQGLGTPVLVARERIAEANMKELGIDPGSLEIWNARLSDQNPDYVDFLYERMQRKGYLRRDVQRLVNNDRNVFSACMLRFGDADGMVTGVTRHFMNTLSDIRLVLDEAPGGRLIGLSLAISRGRTVVIADTNVTEFPEAPELADIACGAAAAARKLGLTPRVAFLSYSTFGNPPGIRTEKIQSAVRLLDARGVDFEYEGEMAADVALNPDHHEAYSFSRLSGAANVLVMPAVHSASIATRLLKATGGATVIEGLLVGLEKSVQIARLGSPVSDIVNLAGMASFDLTHRP